LSQCLLAIPIYGLYEISIWCVRLIQIRRKKADDLADAAAGVAP
jgi:sec-independent protein translocase protein TatC